VDNAITPSKALLQVTDLTARIGAENIHPSVRAAVVAYRDQFGEKGKSE